MEEALNKLVPNIKTSIIVNGATACFLMGYDKFEYIKPIPHGKDNYRLGRINGFDVIVDPFRNWNDLTVYDDKGNVLTDLSK